MGCRRLGCTFGQLPLLEFDGHILCQSAAILRYLGRKYNLAGKDELESAHIDEIGDAALDFMLGKYACFPVFMISFRAVNRLNFKTTAFTPIFSEKDETKKLEMTKAAAATVTERFLKKFDALVEKNGGYLVNNSLTWADISVAHIIDQIERIMSIKLISDDMPGLKKLADNVFNAKGIKEWIAKRPQTHA